MIALVHLAHTTNNMPPPVVYRARSSKPTHEGSIPSGGANNGRQHGYAEGTYIPLGAGLAFTTGFESQAYYQKGETTWTN